MMKMMKAASLLWACSVEMSEQSDMRVSHYRGVMGSSKVLGSRLIQPSKPVDFKQGQHCMLMVVEQLHDDI